MQKIKLIADNDINSSRVYDEVKKITNGKKYIHIAATGNLKELRKNKNKQDYIPYTKDLKNSRMEVSGVKNVFKDINLYTFTELKNFINSYMNKYSNFISNVDQKYLLAELIRRDFSDDNKRLLYTEIRHEIFELFCFLEFYGLTITGASIKRIIEDYSASEGDMFTLYQNFIATLNSIVEMVGEGRSEELEPWLKDVLDINKSDNLSGYDTYQNVLKDIIDKVIALKDVVILDGFLFFNDLQKYLAESAFRQGKMVVLIAKYNYYETTSNFIMEENYKKLATELGTTIDIPFFEDDFSSFDDSTLLNFLRTQYPQISRIPISIAANADKTKVNAESKDVDNSLAILKPFTSRDEELEYVVKDISNYLRDAVGQDEANIKNRLLEVAIVCAVDKEKYEERLDLLFNEVGIFIPDKDIMNKKLGSPLQDCFYSKIYYTKQELLSDDISYSTGVKLSYEEKYRILQGYKTIKASIKERPLASYPIGEFIFQIYRIIKEGMNIEGFKMILYSNWKYNINESNEKWDKYISDFKNIQVYFENKFTIDEWIEIVNSIIASKSNMTNDTFYKWHPFIHVANVSLNFYYQMLQNIKEVIANLEGIKGKVIDHIEGMKVNLNLFQVQDNNFEQKLINRIDKALSQIGKTSATKNIDSKYFAENLRGMIQDWEGNQDEKTNDIQISVVNLENMQKFNRVYYIMLEAEKYPRKYNEEFPFNSEILEILKSAKYGLEKMPYNLNGMDYHLKLERYLFKNVLDFTEKELIITYSEKENGEHNRPSIYIEDIASIFNLPVESCLSNHTNHNNKKMEFISNYTEKLTIAKKSKYTIEELGVFLLCPKAYYHLNYSDQSKEITYSNRFQLRKYAEAILYCKLLDEFMEYNEANDMIYSAHDDQYYYVLSHIIEKVLECELENFKFLNRYEKKDLQVRVLRKAAESIYKNAVDYARCNLYTVIKASETEIEGFIIQNDMMVINKDTGMSYRYRNSNYLEFLTLKTKNRNRSANSIDAILKDLDESPEDMDRINHISKFIFRLNTQLRYPDNLKAAKNIRDIIGSANYYSLEKQASSYCSYCKLSEVCKGNFIEEGEENEI